MRRNFHGCLLLLLSGLSATVCGDNLLEDPGLERQSKVWRSWGSAPAKQKIPVVSFSTERPYEGKFCLRVHDEWTDAKPYATQFFSLPPRKHPAQVLEMTFHARSNRPHRFQAGLLFNRQKPGQDLVCLGSFLHSLEATEQWRRYVLSIPSLPPDANVLNLVLRPTGDQAEEIGDLYFDNLSVHWKDVDPAEALGIDRQAENQQNYPRTPADGAVVATNPPAFVWLPPLNWSRGQYTYTLEYAQNPDFRDAIRHTGISRHLKVPDQTMSPGKWYWRIGVENQPSGTVWTRTWSFTIPENAESAPYPDARVTLNRVPQGHPRLYVTPDTLSDFRRRAREGDLKASADWIRNNFKKYHYYGEKLAEEPAFLPDRRKNFQAWLDGYVKVMNDTRPTQYRMERAALGYLLTGDKALGEEAKRRVLHFFSWDPDGSTSLNHNDEPAMWIMRWGMASYDWTYDLYTPEERRKIENSICRRAEQFYDYLTAMPFDSRPYHSHPNGYLQILGEAAVMLAHERPEKALPWFAYSTETFRAFCPTYGTPDGGWNEGVAYWSYTNEATIGWVMKIRTATGLDLGRKSYFRNAGYYPLYGWPAETRLPSFGDGETPRYNLAMTSAIAASYSGNPDFLTSIRRLGGAPTAHIAPSMPLIVRDWSQLGPARLDRLPTARLFPDIGFVVMRNNLAQYEDDIGLIFECSPFGNTSHRHNAQNCFMLEAYTEPLLLSSGYYDAYESPHHRLWTWETKSHCGLTYDGGRGQLRSEQAAGAITEFRHDKDFDLATGDASRAYPELKRVLRTIVHVRPGLFVIRDRAEADAPHVWEFNLHTVQPGVFDESRQSMALELPKAGLEVRFFAPEPLRFGTFRNTVLPAAPEKRPERWHFRASWPRAARAMELWPVLMPYRTGRKDALPQLEKLPDGIRLAFPDGSVRIVRFQGETVLLERP